MIYLDDVSWITVCYVSVLIHSTPSYSWLTFHPLQGSPIGPCAFSLQEVKGSTDFSYLPSRAGTMNFPKRHDKQKKHMFLLTTTAWISICITNFNIQSTKHQNKEQFLQDISNTHTLLKEIVTNRFVLFRKVIQHLEDEKCSTFPFHGSLPFQSWYS